MRQVRRPCGLAPAGLFALALGLALGGCDGSSPPRASSSTARATVKGKVTLKGKPLAKVEIRFNAANVNRKDAPTSSGVANDDGLYEVTTLVGENSISFGGPTAAKNARGLAYFNKSVDLKAGDNTVDIDIP